MYTMNCDVKYVLKNTVYMKYINGLMLEDLQLSIGKQLSTDYRMLQYTIVY